MINNLPKFVASTTLEAPLEWSNSTLIQGDVAGEVTKLKQQTGGDLRVIGSGDLAQSLMQDGLVDESHLMIHPIVSGAGSAFSQRETPPSR